ncbi:MAG: aminotransferase class III-fold pyridoxal phosphate-dependent enzyme, partial [Aquificaceae bacterium]|nr:aminotransferase class III-fold pyridoxal phosphate-dependent enzyme [Aquificaceae bacterium]
MIGICLQARMGSTRFRGKMLAKINGKPLINWVISRASFAKSDVKALLTSNLEEDDILCEIVISLGWQVVRGDSEDVLERYAKAVELFGLSHVVRITGDCPLIDPELINIAINHCLESKADYFSFSGIIDGFEVEVINSDWILKAYKNAVLPSQREHVTPYVSSSKRAKKVSIKLHEEDFSSIHLSVDYPEDIEVIETVLKELNSENFGYFDVVKLIKSKPELFMREEFIPNLGYRRSIEKDREFVKSLKAKSLSFEKTISHFKRAIEIIPTASQTFSKSYLQLSVGASPLFAKEAKGCIIKDADGNELIDYTMGLGACILGYAFEPILEGLKKQLEKGTIYTLSSTLELELAELISKVIPSAQMVRFGKNGSDVTSAAVRLARAITNRDMVACCGYHGWQDWYIASTTRSAGVPKAVKDLTLSFNYNDIDSLKKLFEQHKDKIACVILEPVGIEEPRDNFLKQVIDISHENGALVVFDEVVTGFRFALGGAQELFNVEPDLSCFGKAMANGLPMSAIVGKSEYMKHFDEVFFSFTFGGETLSIVSAIETINYMRENNVINTLWHRGQRLKTAIENLISEKELEDIAFVKGFPVRFVLDFKTQDALKLKTLFQQECAKRGVLFTGSHNISFSHSDEIIEKTIAVYSEVFEILKYANYYGLIEEMLEGEILQPV